MIKIYIATPMFEQADIEYNYKLASILRSEGFDVYCPNENSSINDKSKNDITPEKIYQADINELLLCNVLLCRLCDDPGVMWEAGYMDCLRAQKGEKYYGCIGLTTDIRWQTPYNQVLKKADNQCYYYNGFVVGGLNLSLGVHYSMESLINRLKQI